MYERRLCIHLTYLVWLKLTYPRLRDIRLTGR